MEIIKIIPNTMIFKISNDYYDELLEKKEKHEFTCNDKRLFIIENKDGFTAIDNSSGDLFTVDFKTRTGAYIWLLGLTEEEPILAIEQCQGWY